MKNVILSICFLVLLPLAAYTQIGFSGTYNSVRTPDWSPIFAESIEFDFPQDYSFENKFGISVDYWLQPFDFRVEFLPTLSYVAFEEQQTNDTNTSIDLNLSMIEFALPIRIYPLDIEGDCDCPTWGKDGSLVKKGFYLSLIPGISNFNLNTKKTFPQSDLKISGEEIVPSIGLGLGLDIGLNKFITLTPYANYKRHFDIYWGLLHLPLNSTSTSDNISNMNQIQAGLRLGIHFKQ